LHKETFKAVTELIKIIEDAKIPLLLDADGLKAYAEIKHKVDFHMVLTPHAGEYQILTGDQLPETIHEKVAHVKKMARELGAVILLKGSVDIITDGERVKLNKYAHNPGMTVGGTGDVLSGIVGAFLSQGFEPFQSAVAGAFINGAAGDFVTYERGYHLLPTDLIELIPKVIDDPMSHMKVRRMPFQSYIRRL
jgi:NAD(P)H-hydrate epimerase